jgi:hypothetical protein
MHSGLYPHTPVRHANQQELSRVNSQEVKKRH